MKLSNFLRFDPEYEGAGLRAGNRIEEEVWHEFVGDRVRLHQVAAAIKSTIGLKDDIAKGDAEDEYEGKEGRILSRLHRVRERDRRLVKRKKESTLRATGALKCEICAVDFQKIYGEGQVLRVLQK